MAAVEIEYRCGPCGEPIADGAGSITLAWSDLAAFRARGQQAVRLGGAFTSPIIAPWRVQHTVCADGGDGYDIEVERVRTWRDVVAMTAHLLTKPWLTATDWAGLIGAGARGEGRRMLPVGEGSAA